MKRTLPPSHSSRHTVCKGGSLFEVSLLLGFLVAILIGFISLFGARVHNNFRHVNDHFADTNIPDQSQDPDDQSGTSDENQGLKSCTATHPLGTNGQNKLLARGFNLPNWDPDFTGFKPDDDFLKNLFDKGYTHIRLPVDGEKLMSAYTSQPEISSFLTSLDAAVTRLTGLGFAVTVDMHPGSTFGSLHETDPQAAYPILKEGWDNILSVASNWSHSNVYFELLNEPTSQSAWWPQAQSLVTYINNKDQNRKIIVGSGVWQRYEPLIGATPIDGKNITYAMHFYDPMVFSHQWMTWDTSSTLSRLHNLPFPGDINHPDVQTMISELEQNNDQEAIQSVLDAYDEPWTSTRIANIFKEVDQWATNNNVPVIVNEFGVLNFRVDEEDRAAWIKSVRQGAENSCIGWAHWDFSQGFGMVTEDTNELDPVIDAALMNDDN